MKPIITSDLKKWQREAVDRLMKINGYNEHAIPKNIWKQYTWFVDRIVDGTFPGGFERWHELLDYVFAQYEIASTIIPSKVHIPPITIRAREVPKL